MFFLMSGNGMNIHISEFPPGAYKKAHRHGPDFHVMCVTGRGYSLLWYEGEADFRQVHWKHGTVFAPPDRGINNLPVEYEYVKLH